MVSKNILFLCDRNTVRSPMAAALMTAGSPQREDLVSKSDQIKSAGLATDDAVEPFACAVLLEDGIDITGHVPAALNPKSLNADTLVIALSMPAFEAARKLREKTGFELDYWDLPHIPSLDAPRDEILDGFRAIRDALKAHIRNRFS